jgi:Amidase
MTPRMPGSILVLALLLSPLAAQADNKDKDDFPFLEATVTQLEAQMAAGTLTSEQLTRAYIRRIEQLDQGGPGVGVNALIELNPDALAIARHADALRRQGKVLGPLHGIPVLLKANIDTGDKMQTTAGSLAAGRPGAARLDRRRQPACRGRGDSRQDQPVGMGEFPLLLLCERLVGGRRTDPQPLWARPQPLWLELGLGSRRVC